MNRVMKLSTAPAQRSQSLAPCPEERYLGRTRGSVKRLTEDIEKITAFNESQALLGKVAGQEPERRQSLPNLNIHDVKNEFIDRRKVYLRLGGASKASQASKSRSSEEPLELDVPQTLVHLASEDDLSSKLTSVPSSNSSETDSDVEQDSVQASPNSVNTPNPQEGWVMLESSLASHTERSWPMPQKTEDTVEQADLSKRQKSPSVTRLGVPGVEKAREVTVNEQETESTPAPRKRNQRLTRSSLAPGFSLDDKSESEEDASFLSSKSRSTTLGSKPKMEAKSDGAAFAAIRCKPYSSEVKSVLSDWMSNHVGENKPNPEDLVDLVRRTALRKEQVIKWLSDERRRRKKKGNRSVQQKSDYPQLQPTAFHSVEDLHLSVSDRQDETILMEVLFSASITNASPERTQNHSHGEFEHSISSASGSHGLLPEDAKKPLRLWLESHLDSLYPSAEERSELERQSGLTATQIQNWFGHERRKRERSGAKAKTRPTSLATQTFRKKTSGRKKEGSEDHDSAISVHTPPPDHPADPFPVPPSFTHLNAGLKRPPPSYAPADELDEFPAEQMQTKLFDCPRRHKLLEEYSENITNNPYSHLSQLGNVAQYIFENGRPIKIWTAGGPGSAEVGLNPNKQSVHGKCKWQYHKADVLLLTESEHAAWAKHKNKPKYVIVRDEAFSRRRPVKTLDTWFEQVRRSAKARKGDLKVDVQALDRDQSENAVKSVYFEEADRQWHRTRGPISDKNPPLNILNIADNMPGNWVEGLSKEYQLLFDAMAYIDGSIYKTLDERKAMTDKKDHGIGKPSLIALTPTDIGRCAQFRIAAQRGAVSSWHMDNLGVYTFVILEGNTNDPSEAAEDVVKYWPFYPLDTLNEEDLKRTLDEYGNYGVDWRPTPVGGIPVISLVRGDVLIQPPGAIHAPVTLTDCFFAGGMCLRKDTFAKSLDTWRYLVEHPLSTNEPLPHQTQIFLEYMKEAVHEAPEEYGYSKEDKSLEKFDRLCQEISGSVSKCTCKGKCTLTRCHCLQYGFKCGIYCSKGFKHSNCHIQEDGQIQPISDDSELDIQDETSRLELEGSSRKTKRRAPHKRGDSSDESSYEEHAPKKRRVDSRRNGPKKRKNDDAPEESELDADRPSKKPSIGIFSDEAKKIMGDWVLTHPERTMLDLAQRELLQRQTGLSGEQVRTWIRRRRRNIAREEMNQPCAVETSLEDRRLKDQSPATDQGPTSEREATQHYNGPADRPAAPGVAAQAVMEQVEGSMEQSNAFQPEVVSQEVAGLLEDMVRDTVGDGAGIVEMNRTWEAAEAETPVEF